MRLNHDYIRNILLFIEENLNYKEYTDTPSYHKTPSFAEVLSDEYFMDYNQEELLYAMELLIREKYIQCTKEPYFVNGSLMSADIVGLTWNGHQFLDNVRNDTVWNAVKEKSKTIWSIFNQDISIRSRFFICSFNERSKRYSKFFTRCWQYS